MLSARKRAEIRRHFRMLRAAQDFSQLDASLAARLTLYRYLLIERGYEVATDAERVNLAKAFKKTVDDIYPVELAVAS